jgi:hypothetical protein
VRKSIRTSIRDCELLFLFQLTKTNLSFVFSNPKYLSLPPEISPKIVTPGRERSKNHAAPKAQMYHMAATAVVP